MNAFSNSCSITAFLSLSLGIVVLIYGHKQKISRLWAMFCFSVGLWSFGLGMMVRAQSYQTAFMWLRWVHYLGAIMIPIFFFHFVVHFLQLQKTKLLWAGYALAFIQQVISLTGNLAQLEPLKPFNYYTVPKPTYGLFVLYFFFYVFYAHWLLFQKIRVADAGMKNQLRYIFVGTSIGFTGGTTAFLPVFHMPVFPYGVYGVFVYILSVSYAILKHRLLDITIIIRKTLIYAVVMGILTSIYLVSVALFAHIFEGLTGYQTVFSSAFAALLITSSFQPIRKRIQEAVDRKFFRQYVDREEKLYELSRDVITHTTSEAMGTALMHVIDETLHPKTSALYLRASSGSGFERVSGTNDGQLPLNLDDEHILASYFKDHPQPFLQEVSNDVGRSYSTRSKDDREDVA